jgi:hypothetical protein
MLVLLALLVLVFAGFGPLIFHVSDRSGADDDVYFDGFGDATWSVFAAITSSSYPNQVMPSYRRFRESALYFVSFIALGAFLLLNLVVVVVLVEFQRNSQDAADVLRANRRILLMRAFALLAKPCPQQPELLVVPRPRMLRLLDALRDQYGDFARVGIPRGEARLVLLDILDVDCDGRVALADFLFLLDVVRIRLQLVEALPTADARGPSSSASSASSAAPSARLARLLQGLARSRVADIVVDALCAALVLASLLLNRRALYASTPSSRLVYLLVTLVCAGQMLVKVAALGGAEALRSFRARFDAVVASLLVVALVVDGGVSAAAGRAEGSQVTGWTLLARCVMMLKLVVAPRNLRALFLLLSQRRLEQLAASRATTVEAPAPAPDDDERGAAPDDDDRLALSAEQRRALRSELRRFRKYQRLVTALSRLLRRVLTKTLTLGIVFMCTGYAFASLGEMVFGGAIRTDLAQTNDAFARSTYASNALFTLNFNDFCSAVLTLFCCLKVSDFDVIASGFATSVDTFGARCFFAAWYVLGVLLLLNVVKSFFLGEFLTLFAGRDAANPFARPQTPTPTAAPVAGRNEDAEKVLRRGLQRSLSLRSGATLQLDAQPAAAAAPATTEQPAAAHASAAFRAQMSMGASRALTEEECARLRQHVRRLSSHSGHSPGHLPPLSA